MNFPWSWDSPRGRSTGFPHYLITFFIILLLIEIFICNNSSLIYQCQPFLSFYFVYQQHVEAEQKTTKNAKSLHQTRVPFYASYVPGGTSTWTFLHWAQVNSSLKDWIISVTKILMEDGMNFYFSSQLTAKLSTWITIRRRICVDTDRFAKIIIIW